VTSTGSVTDDRAAGLRRLDRVAAVARRTGAAALLVGVVSYGVGLFSLIWLDIEEQCESFNDQPFVASEAFPDVDGDGDGESPGRWYWLSQPCNADYDLVPAWVNPVVVVCAVLVLAAVVALVVVAVRRRARRVQTTGSTTGSRVS